MKIKFLIFSLFVLITVASLGCIESKKPPTPNQTEIAKPSVTEQKLPAPNATRPLIINDTFETWSRGYWSNLSYGKPYFRVITNYSEWTAFLDEQGVGVEGKLTLEGTLFPGLSTTPKTIDTADFTDYFIICAMMGTKSYAEEPEIEIKNISRINNVINVTVRIYDTARGTLIPSAPYHIVIVKRELLPAGNSTFVFVDTEGKLFGKVAINE
jgi:hypothetical protein